jgi:hypothetical protein
VVASSANISASVVNRIVLIFKLAVVPPVHGEDDGRIGVRLCRLGLQHGEFFGGAAWAKCVNRAFGAGGGEHEQVPRFIEGEANGIESIIALDREAFFLRPRVDALVVMVNEVELASRVDGCTGDGEETVFKLLYRCSRSENGRGVRLCGLRGIARDVKDSELPLSHIKMMRDIFNSVFVWELAQAQEGAATIVVANAVAALGIYVDVTEVNI